MKKRITTWILHSIRSLGLAAVLSASACAPTAPAVAADTPLASLAAPTQALETASQPQASTEAATAQIPQAAATSRGPNLEASDPTSAALASGGLQLVEFFRFT